MNEVEHRLVPVHCPTSLDAAVRCLTDEPDVQLIAGGTDVMVAVNGGRLRFESVVSIDRIRELRTWRRDGDDLVLGAGVTFTQLGHHELVAWQPALAQAARTIGSPQIRNAATIGGNVGTASPAGDSLPVLAAAGASVVLRSTTGERTVAITDFLVGPKRTARRADELIVAVRIPMRRGPQEFLKVGTRNAMVIAVASLAAIADLDRRTLAIALGSVGPTVLRVPEAEAFAAAHIDWRTGTLPDGGAVAERFGALVRAAARPIDDHRSTAEYRRHCVGVLATRALRRLFPHAHGSEVA